MIWLSVFDLVRRWSAPVEQDAAIHLPWLADSLRDTLRKTRRVCQEIWARRKRGQKSRLKAESLHLSV